MIADALINILSLVRGETTFCHNVRYVEESRPVGIRMSM